MGYQVINSMVMDAIGANQQIYNRAIGASVESSLRHANSQKKPENAQPPPDQSPTNQSKETRRAEHSAQNQLHRTQDETSTREFQRKSNEGFEPFHRTANSRAEKNHDSRQSEARKLNNSRKNVFTMLASHTGKRANESYLAVADNIAGHMVDEMV